MGGGSGCDADVVSFLSLLRRPFGSVPGGRVVVNAVNYPLVSSSVLHERLSWFCSAIGRQLCHMTSLWCPAVELSADRFDHRQSVSLSVLLDCKSDVLYVLSECVSRA